MNEKTQEIMVKICEKALSEIDMVASYFHYVVFEEIKIIKKENKNVIDIGSMQNLDGKIKND